MGKPSKDNLRRRGVIKVKPKPISLLQIKIRKCLKCDKLFESEGDRICPKCTVSNTLESKRMSRTARSITGNGMRGRSRGVKGDDNATNH